MAKNISESNIMVGKLVAVLVALLLVAVLVYPVINTVGNGGGGTGTTIDNEGAEWLKVGYVEGTDFEFVITDDGTDVTVGEQTGPLGDMIYYADENRVIFSKGTTMYLMTAGDNSNVYAFNDSVSVTNSNGTITIYDGSAVIDTASSPVWAYYPDANGGYGFFTNGNLNLLENEPKVAVGSYAGVFAYNKNIVTPDDVDLGLVMTGDYATGDVTWAVSSDDESNDEPAVQPLASQPSMVVMGSASAEMQVMGTANPPNSTKIGDLYYSFYMSEASVTGYSSTIDWNTLTSIPDTVTYNGTTYTVTSIGGNAFKNCTNLALTSLPSGLTSIGQSAFYGCTSLALTSLPSGLTSIGSGAFSGCKNITISSLPVGITTIESQTFSQCERITLSSLPASLTYIGEYTFNQCERITLSSLPAGVTSIGNYAFNKCTRITLSELPSGLTSIGNYAFTSCRNITLSSLPSSVNSIGEQAFAGCTNITLTSLPQNLTQIKAGTFNQCTNLALTELPSGITRIESNAFERCTNLALTELPDNLTYIGLSAFNQCSNISLTTLPNNITTIEYFAFSMCTNLALTELPSGITSIGEQAFSNTPIELTSLPDGLTTIGRYAFSRCTNLAITSIPVGVTTIGVGAFYECTNITSLIFEGSPTIGTNAFQNTGIKEILNLGETEITTTSYGLNADSVQDYIGALGYIAPTHIQEGSSDSGYDVDGVSMAVLKIVPIILLVSILLVLVMPMIQSRTV